MGTELRSEGLVTVFTNGCFDILHPGHVHLLRLARAMGDILFLGVNTDASVSRLKGSRRPIHSLEARTIILTELRSVDFIIPFEEDTPLELIHSLSPDILVKGGDYTIETVVGADSVIASGGIVRIVPLLEGYSTSSIACEIGKDFQNESEAD